MGDLLAEYTWQVNEQNQRRDRDALINGLNEWADAIVDDIEVSGIGLTVAAMLRARVRELQKRSK